MEEMSREKVIKGLVCHFLVEMNVCEKCPYYPNENCTDDMAKDVLALLKAQEPLEPIRPGLGVIHHDNGSKSYFLHCPLDGTTLLEGDNYCRRCGRAVKWR